MAQIHALHCTRKFIVKPLDLGLSMTGRGSASSCRLTRLSRIISSPTYLPHNLKLANDKTGIFDFEVEMKGTSDHLSCFDNLDNA